MTGFEKIPEGVCRAGNPCTRHSLRLLKNVAGGTGWQSPRKLRALREVGRSQARHRRTVLTSTPKVIKAAETPSNLSLGDFRIGGFEGGLERQVRSALSPPQ